MDDTIAAVATAPGRAGVAVIRVSGPSSFEIASCLCGVRPGAAFPFAHHVRFKYGGEVLDDGVLLLFKGPASYTGEDVAEFQCHGGHVESERILSAAIALGARIAEPGEFTRRAFLNGKVDLSEAEAVMDLINARTERAAIAARAQMDGSLSRRVDEIYELVVAVTADVEHLLDFDEGEIPAGFALGAADRVASASKSAKELSDGWRHGEIVRDGVVAVISGAPNAGKSSLMNALLGRSRAIVSDVPGTTRDSIEAELEIDGIPVRLVDTAGIRPSASDAIEAEGIERAGEAVQGADINLRVVDVADGALAPPGDLPVERTVVVLNKCDLVDAVDTAPLAGWNTVEVSVREGRGLDALRAKMAGLIGADDKAVDASSVSLRHRECLDEARGFLDQAAEALGNGDGDLVVAAGLLRMAAESIGRITGRVWSEDILDAVFSRFCVGK